LTYSLTDYIGIFFCEYPRLLVESSALRTVGTHYRAESAILEPSCVHFRIDVVSEVASDVVAPISVEHIRCCRCEIWLELEGFPGDSGISRETYLVTMVSEAAPTMVEEWTFVSITLHITEIAVVYPPGIMQFGELCIEYVLLPVEPPEINAFLLHRMHHLLEHIAHKLLVRIDPFYAVL
jgi:hypothetical protein